MDYNPDQDNVFDKSKSEKLKGKFLTLFIQLLSIKALEAGSTRSASENYTLWRDNPIKKIGEGENCWVDVDEDAFTEKAFTYLAKILDGYVKVGIEFDAIEELLVNLRILPGVNLKNLMKEYNCGQSDGSTKAVESAALYMLNEMIDQLENIFDVCLAEQEGLGTKFCSQRFIYTHLSEETPKRFEHKSKQPFVLEQRIYDYYKAKADKLNPESAFIILNSKLAVYKVLLVQIDCPSLYREAIENAFMQVLGYEPEMLLKMVDDNQTFKIKPENFEKHFMAHVKAGCTAGQYEQLKRLEIRATKRVKEDYPELALDRHR